jgi:hypothetical protein
MTDRKRFQQMFRQARNHFDNAMARGDFPAADRWANAMADVAKHPITGPGFTEEAEGAQRRVFNAKHNIAD